MIIINQEDEIYIKMLVDVMNQFIQNGYIIPDDDILKALEILSSGENHFTILDIPAR